MVNPENQKVRPPNVIGSLVEFGLSWKTREKDYRKQKKTRSELINTEIGVENGPLFVYILEGKSQNRKRGRKLEWRKTEGKIAYRKVEELGVVYQKIWNNPECQKLKTLESSGS